MASKSEAYKPSMTRWVKYTGNKYFEVKHLDQYAVPDFETYAEPCCGTGAVAFYYMSKTTDKTFILNDRDKDVVGMLRKLYEEGPDAVFNDETWRKYQAVIRYSESKKDEVKAVQGRPKFEAGQYLPQLNYCYELMHKHTITFSNLDVVEFMDTLPSDAFVVLDPPYISLILKYRYEDFGIDKLIVCIGKLRAVEHWILYNDEVAPHLAVLANQQSIHYSIKRGRQTERIEYMFSNLVGK
jgi:hypothetical protein